MILAIETGDGVPEELVEESARLKAQARDSTEGASAGGLVCWSMLSCQISVPLLSAGPRFLPARLVSAVGRHRVP